MKTLRILYIVSFIICSSSLFSQTNVDSLLLISQNKSLPDSAKCQVLLGISEAFIYKSPDSSEYFGKLALQLTQHKSTKNAVNAYNIIGRSYYYRQLIDSALFYYHLGMNMSLDMGDSNGYYKVLNNASYLYGRIGEGDKEKMVMHKAHNFWEKSNDTLEALKATYNLALYYLKVGKADRGVSLLEEVLPIAQSVNDIGRLGDCYNVLGSVEMGKGNFAKAIDLFFKSIDYNQQLNKIAALGLTWMNIGSIAYEQQDHSESIKYLKKALAMCKQVNYKEGMVLIYMNTGLSYDKLEQYDSAIFYQHLALDLCVESQNIYQLAKVYHSLSNAYGHSGDYSNGIKYAQLSSELSESKFEGLYALAVLELGINHLNEGNLSKARFYLLKAEKLVPKIQSLRTTIKTYYQLEIYYTAVGNFKNAHKYLKLAVVLDDSLWSENNQREVLRQKYQYDYDKATLADSLKQTEELLKAELAHQEEIAAKNQTRNILIGSGLFVLLLAGGGWTRARYIKQANKKLAIEKQKAEESEAFKQQFLANMSHEIRTPMNAILGMTNLTLDTKLTKKQEAYLTGVKKSSENLLVIINDILDLSKLEAGGLELEDIAFDLHELLEQVYQTLHFKAEEKSLELIIKKEDDLPSWVKGDPTRLSQVLINLTSNAIKFTEKGSVTLEVTKRENQLHFAVQDTGVGIKPADQQKLFEAFKQADKSTTRKYGGTGLGLSIAQEFVQLMGGQIKIESQEGKGSTFYFDLTLEETEAGTIKTTSKSDTTNLKGIKILLAEDNKYNQIVVVDTLLNLVEDVTIDTANNGKEALAHIQSNDYDIILMDSDMPVMDGREATRAIRQLDNNKKDIPIIALTASVLATEIGKCLEAGMNDSIPKPFSRDEFFATIGKYYESSN